MGGTYICTNPQITVTNLPRDIEHRTRVGRLQTNGFVEGFHGTALHEFFRLTFRQSFYESVEALQQADFDVWLVHYNTERPHLGYRNQGRTPWQTVQQFLEPSTEVSA